MRTQRPTPLRGLLAGLLALIAFSSTAVAMTAGGSSGSTAGVTQALPTQTVVVSADGGDGRGRDDDGDVGRRHR